MKLYVIVLSALVILSFEIRAQDIGLTVGDKLPEFVIPEIIGIKQKEIKTSNFKDRLLILDFWATNCSGCVAALPKMNQLQIEFGSKIKILPITQEPFKQVFEFWKNNKYTKNLLLSTVVNDKKFSFYFKHIAVPHEVWIYKGVIIAITAGDYIDSINIQKVLQGKSINWPIKNDFYVFDGAKYSLFLPDTNQVYPSSILRYVAISDYKEKVNSSGISGPYGSVKDSLKKNIRTFFLNSSIYTAYIRYWSRAVSFSSLRRPQTGALTPNQIIWEVSDKSKFIFDPKLNYEQDWIRKFGICYESINPDTGQTDKEISKNVINDLNRLLGLNVRWEKRKDRVWVLKAINSKNAIINPVGQNILLNDIVYTLNLQPLNPYVFNETDYDDNSSIPIQLTNWTDIKIINKHLSSYGLALIEEERVVDKFIFSQTNENLIPDAEMVERYTTAMNSQKELKFPTKEENVSFLNKNKLILGVITLSSGLQYKIIRMGTGRKPTLEDKVKVNYIGKFVNGKIFDSSLQNGKSAVLPVNNLIEGWKQALQLMPVGSKWILYIPSELGYGVDVSNNSIPQNSTLVFELELIDILN